MVKKYAIGGINNVIGADYNQTQLNPNYGLFEPNLGGNVGKYQIDTAAINSSTDNQTNREQPTVRERNFNFADFTNNVNNYSKFNYPQFNPYYRPNPAFQTGLAYGVDASPAAKLGTTSDLLFQSLFNLSNKLQPFLQDTKLYKNQEQLRNEQTRGSQRVEQAQMFQYGGALDPTALAPNEIQLKPSDAETTQADLFPQLKYDLFPQPQTDFVPFQIQDPNLTTAQPVRQEPSRATAEDTSNKAANIVGATAAVGSFGMDLAKGIAGGIGVGRRSAYAYDRAQEKMREATINQGFEKGREDLFNQGYLQTTGFLAQNGGQTPIVVSNPNDPRLQAYNDSLFLHNEWKKDENFVRSNPSYKDFLKSNDKTIAITEKAKNRLTKLNGSPPDYTSEYIGEGKKFEEMILHFPKPNQPVILKERTKQEPIKNVSVVDPLNNQSNNQTPEKLNIDTSIKNNYSTSSNRDYPGYLNVHGKDINGIYNIIGYRNKQTGAYTPKFQDGGEVPIITPEQEVKFQEWYSQYAGLTGGTPNPDDPTLNMDFRSKWLETGGKLPNGEVVFQSGGQIPVPPIVVTDPNDPRLQAYNDSLDLYNISNNELQKTLQELKSYGYKTDEIKVEETKDNTKHMHQQYKKNALYNNSYLDFLHSNIEPVSSYNVYTKEDKYNAPNFVKNLGFFDDKLDFFADTGLIYKKPNQPVIYQKPTDDKSFTKTKTSIVNTPKPIPRPKQEPIKNVSVVDPLNTSTNNQNLSKIDMDTKMKNPNNTKQSRDYPGYEEVIGPDVNGITRIIGYKNKQTGAYTPKFQDGGAIPVSMNGLKEYPNQEVIVPSNNITMKGINYDVLAFPNNDQPVLMKPDQNYQFPNSTQVLEKPMMKNGGMIKLEEGLYYNPTTQEFIQQ
jgi:hypothetical protein